MLITGASGGLGAALAECYARPGSLLLLHGRDRARLAAVAARCEAHGAHTQVVTLDLRDHAAVQGQLRALSDATRIDLAIVNAGITHRVTAGPQEPEGESLAAAREVLAVNLDGALATIAAVLPQMRRRGSGQIALLSSLAAYHGLPNTPAYCASKAALRAYGEALRLWLGPEGIAVNVVMPGFIDTPMTASRRGPSPGLLSAPRAALLIQRGLARNRGCIAFPRMLAWGLRWLTLLPAPLSKRILRAAGFGAARASRLSEDR